MPSIDVRPPSRALALAVALSCALHALLGWLVAVVFKAPDLGIEFELPIDVELGLTSEVDGFAPHPSPSPMEPEPTPPPPSDAVANAELEEAERKREERKREREEKAKREREAREAAAKESAQLAQTHEAESSRLPPGAQIAIRVDMTRIRASAVAEDIRALLAAVPDWKALLDGSGIDPVDQLDRLLIATPNLQRSKIVLAGRFIGDPALVDEAVARLAEARGVTAKWSMRDGVRVAPWANLDETKRVIALVGPSHFTITRPEDLARVLAIAAARAQDKDAKPRNEKDEHPADALLSMEEGEGLSLEVEGVERFVRKAKRGVPQRLRLSAVEIPGPKVELRVRMTFADGDSAEDAQRFWTAQRDAYARNALVALLGLSSPLRDATLELVAEELRIKATLTVEQTRLIIGYVKELITPPPPPPALPDVPENQAGARLDPSGAPPP